MSILSSKSKARWLSNKIIMNLLLVSCAALCVVRTVVFPVVTAGSLGTLLPGNTVAPLGGTRLTSSHSPPSTIYRSYLKMYAK